MIDSLKDKGNSHEAKHAHDEALKFRALARRDKLIGIWAGKELGFDDTDAEVYARAIVLSAIDSGGNADDGIVRKILTDFKDAKIDHTRKVVVDKMAELLTQTVDALSKE